jgi:hypothetical protein
MPRANANFGFNGGFNESASVNMRAPEVRVEAPRVNGNFNAGIGGGFNESASLNVRAPEVRV